MTTAFSDHRAGEVGFVLAAIRRYFLIVVAVSLAGVVVGAALGLWHDGQFAATSSLEVLIPTRTAGGSLPTDPNRHVESQLVVLRDQDLAERVSAALDAEASGSLSPQELMEIVEVEAEPKTSVVTITARSSDPGLAAAIANAYADIYVTGLPTSDLDEGQRQLVQRRVDELEEELAALDAELRDAMAPFLAADPGDGQQELPSPDAVAPETASRRLVVQAELEEAIGDLADLVAQSRIRQNTSVIAEAVTPTEPEPREYSVVAAGVILAGFVGSVAVAVAVAGLSPTVLDVASVQETLGRPLTARIKRSRRRQPQGESTGIDELCFALESSGPHVAGLVVAVTATSSAPEAPDLATALAGRFVERGHSTVLLAARSRADPSDVDEIATSVRVPTRIGRVDGDDNAWSRLDGDAVRDVLTILVARDGNGGRTGPSDLAATISELAMEADVVVVDADPLDRLVGFDRLAEVVDATVLVIPVPRQDRRSLERGAVVLSEASTRFLPVTVERTLVR